MTPQTQINLQSGLGLTTGGAAGWLEAQAGNGLETAMVTTLICALLGFIVTELCKLLLGPKIKQIIDKFKRK